MIKFIITADGLPTVDYDITDHVMGCDRIHETIIDDGGGYEFPELSFTCDDSENWSAYYLSTIQATRLYLYVFDDSTLLYAGMFRNNIPAYNYAQRSVTFYTDSILQIYKRSYDILFFSGDRYYKLLLQMAPFGGFEAFTKLTITQFPAVFNIGSFGKTFKEVYLKSNYSDGKTNILTVWGDVLRAVAGTYIWRNGYYRVQTLGGVLYEAATSQTNITDDVLAINKCQPWSKARSGVVLTAGDNKYYSAYGSDKDNESAQISAPALNYLWFQSGNDKESLEDAYAPSVVNQYGAYFTGAAGDNPPKARIAYDAELEGLDYYCGQGVKINYLPGTFFIDDLYRDIEKRTTEIKMVSL